MFEEKQYHLAVCIREGKQLMAPGKRGAILSAPAAVRISVLGFSKFETETKRCVEESFGVYDWNERFLLNLTKEALRERPVVITVITKKRRSFISSGVSVVGEATIPSSVFCSGEEVGRWIQLFWNGQSTGLVYISFKLNPPYPALARFGGSEDLAPQRISNPYVSPGPLQDNVDELAPQHFSDIATGSSFGNLFADGNYYDQGYYETDQDQDRQAASYYDVLQPPVPSLTDGERKNEPVPPLPMPYDDETPISARGKSMFRAANDNIDINAEPAP
eukprot:g4399.t1